MHINSRVIIGTDGLVAEDTNGVASFSENTLVLRANGGAISISGEKIVIVSMEEGRVIVNGKIGTVSFL